MITHVVTLGPRGAWKQEEMMQRETSEYRKERYMAGQSAPGWWDSVALLGT